MSTLTAGEVVARIKANLGFPWMERRPTATHSSSEGLTPS